FCPATYLRLPFWLLTAHHPRTYHFLPLHDALPIYTLSEREAKVLRLYYGLGDCEPLTLEQIGERFGITRERVRQIKERALERLRHQSRARFLETFISRPTAPTEDPTRSLDTPPAILYHSRLSLARRSVRGTGWIGDFLYEMDRRARR